MEVARHLHAQSAQGRSGVIVLRPRDESDKPIERRVELRAGLICAIDPGPSAPVGPEAQLRYILRQRGRPEFSADARLSLRFAVDEFRPDATIRQHIDAQALSPDPLRQHIGTQRISVTTALHASALHAEEIAAVRFLKEPRTVPELLEQGAKAGAWSPLRAMKLLVVLDALGTLVVGEIGAALRQAYKELGLEVTADLDEVKQAYRRRARTLHPDSQPNLPAEALRELTDRFTALHAAYRLLMRHKGELG
jgi:DnaJ-domain-containing protein 1